MAPVRVNRKRFIESEPATNKKLKSIQEESAESEAEDREVNNGDDLSVDEDASMNNDSDDDASDSGAENQSRNKDVNRSNKNRPKLTKVKPPTAEEMQQLRDTEDLFKNNLFKMQLDELLGAIRVDYSKCGRLEKAFWRIKEIMENVQEQPDVELAQAIRHLSQSQNIQIPFPQPTPNPKTFKARFAFKKPTAVRVIGSYMIRALCKGASGGLNADLAVEMPKSLFLDKDHLNNRYFYKRAYYLAMLAAAVKQAEFPCEMKFAYLNNDQRRPILVLSSKKDGSELDFSSTGVCIRIIPSLPEDAFAWNRLAPGRNAFRPDNFTESSDVSALSPTPHYNNSLLAEATFAQHLNFVYTQAKRSDDQAQGAFKDASVLIKAWLRQRGLDNGQAGALNGFFMTMVMAWLFTAGGVRGSPKLSPAWSSYQLFRVTMEWLATHDVLAQPIIMTPGGQWLDAECGFGRDAFVKNFDVVIVDPSGRVNLAANMTAEEWRELQHEAQLTTALLSDSNDDHFEDVFLRNLTHMEARFDLTCQVRGLPDSCRLTAKLVADDDHCTYTALARALPTLLSQGLSTRARLITKRQSLLPSWALGDKPALYTGDRRSVQFCILFDPAQYNRVVDHGPAADKKVLVEQFVELWGDKADLRRFKDGSISKSVVWDLPENAGPDDRANIPRQALQYLLQRHAGVKSDNLVFLGSHLLSPLIKLHPSLASVSSVYAQTNNAFQPIVASLDQFTKQLKSLETLPLSIIDIRPAHPALRYSSVHIPQPRPLEVQSIAASMEMSPWMDAMDVLIEFESSNRWPNDFEAIQKLKGAFLVALANQYADANPGSTARVVRGSTSMLDKDGASVIGAGFVDVMTAHGYAYRCHIHYPHEGVLLERALQDPKTTVEQKKVYEYCLKAYLHQFVLKPQHTQLVRALVQQHPVLSSTMRLVKRWMASQWLLPAGQEVDNVSGLPLGQHIPDEAIELLCVKVFVDPAPYSTPTSAWCGFIRVVNLISTWNWKDEPMIVSLEHGAASPAIVDAVREQFKKRRQEDPLGTRTSAYIVSLVQSPADDLSSDTTRALQQCAELWRQSTWTCANPSRIVLERLVKLARVATSHIKSLSQLQSASEATKAVRQLFAHSDQDYDVVLRLEPAMCARYLESIHPDRNRLPSGQETFKNLAGSSASVWIKFDAVACFIAELKRAFGDLALFFHDGNGGTTIGVVFNPAVCTQPRPFKPDLAFPCVPVPGGEKNKKARVVANVDAIVHQMALMGQDLVIGVERRHARTQL